MFWESNSDPEACVGTTLPMQASCQSPRIVPSLYHIHHSLRWLFFLHSSIPSSSSILPCMCPSLPVSCEIPHALESLIGRGASVAGGSCLPVYFLGCFGSGYSGTRKSSIFNKWGLVKGKLRPLQSTLVSARSINVSRGLS